MNRIQKRRVWKAQYRQFLVYKKQTLAREQEMANALGAMMRNALFPQFTQPEQKPTYQ